ncbi:hypothetical protein NRS6120_16315 [Bacillus subtilis]|nr:hypothetical protein [Bacillus subtilis]CAF1762111.1 hypothetical protein NRS6120_01580 [Bacillus subtilis]CAI6301609.1 hypothetical protein NRS6120_16315 [Bacillus subtilis]
MNRKIIKKMSSFTMVWDTEEKRSHLISNDEAAKLEKEQDTTKEPSSGKTEEKPKQTKTKPAAKKDETTDGE